LIVEATSIKAAIGFDLPIFDNSTKAWAAECDVNDPSFGMINSRAATVSSDFYVLAAKAAASAALSAWTTDNLSVRI